MATVKDVIIPQKLIELNKVEGVYLAGGSLTRLVLKSDFNPTQHDLNFFVVGPTQEIREQRIREFIDLVDEKAVRTNMHMVDIVQNDGTKIQTIMTCYDGIEKVVSLFDFSLSQLWLTKQNQVQGTDSAAHSIESKINHVTTKHQWVSAHRIQKYNDIFQLKDTIIHYDNNGL